MLLRTHTEHVPYTIRLPTAIDSSNEITLGRQQALVDVLIDDQRNNMVISRLHAKIIRHDQPNRQCQYEIVAVGTNGISINGIKKSSHRLIDGDEISFAPAAKYPTELTYVFKSQPDSNPSISLSNSPSFNRIVNQSAHNVSLQKHIFNSVSEISVPSKHHLNHPTNHSVSAPHLISPRTPQLIKQTTEPIFDECGNYDQIDDAWQRDWIHDEKSEQTNIQTVNQLKESESVTPYSLDPELNRQTTPVINSASSVEYSIDSSNISHSVSQTSSQSDSWNLRFQKALSEPEDTPEQVMHKYALLSRLNTDFVTLARNYGRTIISEYFLPSHLQTIPFDRMLGGFAGGRKYTVFGILFKLCTDIRVREDKWLYGGDQPSIERANKAGANELRAAVNCFQFHSIGVHVPIIACVEYAGFRLLAMPILPIKPGSQPVYGSSDSGCTVHADDDDVNSRMFRMSTELHWAPHQVNHRLLYSAGDVEGHRGEDGRLYLIDLARCFPPENPFDPVTINKLDGTIETQSTKAPVNTQSVFYAQLRPELLQILRFLKRPPLSPDAFTRWGIIDSERLNADVRAATDFMRADCIAALAEEWCSGVRSEVIKQVMMDEYDHIPISDTSLNHGNQSINHTIHHHEATFQADEELRASERHDSSNSDEIRHLRLSEELHLHGVNVRHLGILRYHILHNQSIDLSLQHNQANEMAELLLVEMISRALKNLLRAELRECIQKVNDVALSAEFDSIRCIVHFMNRITGAEQAHVQPTKSSSKRTKHPSNDDVDEFWSVTVTEAIRVRFGECALYCTDNLTINLQELVSRHLIRVIGYLCLCCGIAFSPSCEHSFSQSPRCFTFTEVDCELRATVESMPIIDYAEVRLLMAQAQQHRAKALPILNQTINQSNKRKRARSVGPALMKIAANSLSTSCRLLSLAVQLFDHLRHALPFNSRFKSEARSCRSLLKQQQKQLIECEQQTEIYENTINQSYTQSAWHFSQSQQLSQSQQSSGPSLSQGAIRTGLSSGFARFAVSSQASSVHQTGGYSNLQPISASHSIVTRTHSHARQLAPPHVLQSPMINNQATKSHYLSPQDTTFSLAISLDPADDDEMIDKTEVLPIVMSLDPTEHFKSPPKSTSHSLNHSPVQTPSQSNVQSNVQSPQQSLIIPDVSSNAPVTPLRRSERTKSRIVSTDHSAEVVHPARATRSRVSLPAAEPITTTSPQSIKPKRRRLKKLVD